ncbi:MAG TPA: hypothetical protein VI300_12930 [Solirubrobacter sp.]
MKVLWALLAIAFVALALPVLVVLGFALGPAALVILFVLVCAMPVLAATAALRR